MLQGDGWSLGSMGREISEARPLTEEERARIPVAMDRLRDFSAHSLIAPLLDALNALQETFDELPTVRQSDIQRGPFRSRLNGRLRGALTAFTSVRATVEATARSLDLPFPSNAPDSFQALYREHRSFRFIWMLRNLDQHRPPASVVINISADEDPETGEKRTRPMIDVRAVSAKCAAESSKDSYRRQWEECGALWADQSEPVDIRQVLLSALEACEITIAAFVREAEAVILSDVQFIARLAGEIEPFGAALAIRVETDEHNPKLIHIDSVPLDLQVLGEALASVDGARKVLGLPPIADSDWPEPLVPDEPATDTDEDEHDERHGP